VELEGDAGEGDVTDYSWLFLCLFWMVSEPHTLIRYLILLY